MMFLRGAIRGIRIRTEGVPRRRNLTAAAILAIYSLAVSHSALADELDSVVHFNIAPQGLHTALLAFGTQAHLQMVFALKSAAAGLQTRGVKGNYSSRNALAELLKGSNLTYVARGTTVQILRKVSSYQNASAERSNAIHAVPYERSDEDAGKEDESVARYRKNEQMQLQEIVVTGSRLRTQDKGGAREVQVYSRSQIEQSGRNSISEFLATIPSVSSGSPSTAMGFATTVNLRGLPVGTTLVLVNGRRLENSGLAYLAGGGAYFDLSNIPLAAVQRIEVDEGGSSAVYGSDAIAGVINIILRKDFDGFEANARYGWAKGVNVVRADSALGRQWNRGGISLIASYEMDGDILNSQRLLSASNDYAKYGGPDNNYPVCSRANVFSTTGAPLPGAPVGGQGTYAGITEEPANGTPSLSQFIYGSLNECSLVLGTALQPSTHRAGLFVQGHFEVAPDVQLFTEIMYTHLTQNIPAGYQELFGLPGFQEYTLSAANPYNPFGTTVGISESVQAAPAASIYDTDFFRPLVGLKGALGNRWQWEISAWQSSDWTAADLQNFIANSGAIQNALNSSDPATAFNPFTSAVAATVLKSMFANADTKMTGRDRSAEAFVRGSVLRLPAGDVQAVVGGDYVRSALHIDDVNDGTDPPNTRLNYERTYSAVFGEARVPIIGPRAKGPAGPLVALSVSGRRDQYSQVGGTTTGQIGLQARPVGGVLVRATYGNAFQAPSLTSLYAPNQTASAVVVDPSTGKGELIRLVTGGNSHLRPLTGRSHTIGLVYSGSTIPDLTLAATQWGIRENNNIQAVSPQVIVNNEDLFGARVIRNADGSIAEVVDTTVNFGSIDVAGVDYQIDYRRPIVFGVIGIDLNATQTYHYSGALKPGAIPVDSAGKAQSDGDWAPKWKGMVSLGWTDGPMSAHLTGHYTSSYLDYGGASGIGNIWIFDATLRWNFRGLGLAAGRRRLGGYVEAGATNLFNRAPQFSNYNADFYGYDASQMSIIGRSLYLQAGVNL